MCSKDINVIEHLLVSFPIPTASLQRVKIPPSMSVLDMTQNYWIVRLQSGSSRECGVPFHCNDFQVHS